jgi:hypothetical protein
MTAKKVPGWLNLLLDYTLYRSPSLAPHFPLPRSTTGTHTQPLSGSCAWP